MQEWSVMLRAEGRIANNDTGGLLVLLTDGKEQHEVSRVAFVRRHSKNPDVPFLIALQRELDKATEAADALNDMQEQFRTAQEQAHLEAIDRVAAIFPNLPTLNDEKGV